MEFYYTRPTIYMYKYKELGLVGSKTTKILTDLVRFIVYGYPLASGSVRVAGRASEVPELDVILSDTWTSSRE